MNTTTQQDALIDAAEERAKLYDGDDRECIKVDVMNAFFAGAAYAQAAANKAAEEGGLPVLPEPYGLLEFEADTPGGLRTVAGYCADDMRAYANEAIAADRASRQVANKADVEQDAARYQFLRHADLDEMKRIYWPEGEVPSGAEFDAAIDHALSHIATPPATTGASTVLNEDQWISRMQYDAEVDEWAIERSNLEAEIEKLKGSVGASTVLTDERIDEIVRQAYWAGRMQSWGGFKKDDDGKYTVPMLSKMHYDLAREVAAQAGQVAVPEHPQFDASKGIYWFSILHKCSALLEVPDDEPIPSGVLKAVQKLVCERAAAPSPAKESK